MQNRLKQKFVIMIWGLMVLGSALTGLGYLQSSVEMKADMSADSAQVAGLDLGDPLPDIDSPIDENDGRNWY